MAGVSNKLNHFKLSHIEFCRARQISHISFYVKEKKTSASIINLLLRKLILTIAALITPVQSCHGLLLVRSCLPHNLVVLIIGDSAMRSVLHLTAEFLQ